MASNSGRHDGGEVGGDGDEGGGPPGVTSAPDEAPTFGPSGYLPERAAKRARKIVLRAPLGLQWVVGALAAGLVVLVAGVLFLRSGDAPPPDPWVEVATLDELGPSEYVAEIDAVVLTATGRVRAFADAADVAYCPASNRLEAPDGRVWSATGRGLGGTPSLAEHPTLLRSGTVYVDPTRREAGPPASTEPAEPACR